MKHLYSISRGEKGFRGKKGKLVKQWALNQANTSESGRFKGREKNAFQEWRQWIFLKFDLNNEHVKKHKKFKTKNVNDF